MGGMVATNTGGACLIKYGDVRANLCSVDVWLPGTGKEPLTLGTALRKNNTGIEFKHLLCGTAGALGVVLRATVRLHPLPRQRATALVVPRSPAALMELVAGLERDMPEFVASIEGMSGAAMEAVFRHIPSARNPFTLEGKVIAFDVSVPRQQWSHFREWAQSWMATNFPSVRICDFGHVADGGLHFNLVAPEDGAGALSADAVGSLRTAILDKVVEEFNGSYSAEHGIGPYNRVYYERFTPAKIRNLASLTQRIFMADTPCGNVRFD
jgi:FAD/FMN-containing dehydrogenase